MRQNIFLLIAWITISIAIGLVMILGFWLLYPYKPLVFLNQPFEVLTPEVKVGELLIYHTDYCKYINLSAETTRSFIDSVKYTMPVAISTNPIGCKELFPALTVPNIPPGIYHLKNSYKYQVNPVRVIVVEATTSAFKIIK